MLSGLYEFWMNENEKNETEIDKNCFLVFFLIKKHNIKGNVMSTDRLFLTNQMIYLFITNQEIGYLFQSVQNPFLLI